MEYVKSENFLEKLSVCTFDMDNVPADKKSDLSGLRKFLTDPRSSDVICLQSVSESMREQVVRIAMANRYHVQWIRESLRYQNGTYYICFAMIIIRKRSFFIERHGCILLEEFPQDTSFLSQMFTDTMRTFASRTEILHDLHAMWADVNIGSRTIRFFCIHLPFVATSQNRMQMMRTVLEKRPGRHTILLGNLNVYETLTAGFVKCGIEGTSRHVISPRCEREEMEELFREHELSNTLRGYHTANRLFGRNQPDHILVPKENQKDWRVSPLDKKCLSIGELIGSRHLPATITVQFNRSYAVSADEQLSW